VPNVVMYFGVVLQRGDGKHSVNARDQVKTFCDICISLNASPWFCRRTVVVYF